MHLTTAADKFETITDAYYQKVGEDSEAFVIVTDDCEYQVPNEGYSIDNPAMQLMGYFGVKPSTFDEQLPGHVIPTHGTVAGDRVISQAVFQNGRWALKNEDWITE